MSFEMKISAFTSDLVNAPGAIRTHGPRIRNPVLYPPELRGHMEYQLVTVSIAPLRVNVVPIRA